MGYLFLVIAIAACVIGSSFLTASDGMKHKGYAVSGVALFVLSYALLSRSILTINISIAYAVFCGVGIVLSGLISAIIFHQKITKIGIACMILILVACVYVHIFGTM
ncbi:MAG: SMR family transporter [Bacillota bacterium]|nr:SMR family transporter [Bacillota bacterium]